ncbi:MAG: 2-octaprenyl-6-methoxyphenyl hydroxylase [Methylicorpusculum sp.]|uniref:2-octaprenyl-6-methoxyphenyl hydroxylase n=1 Tax=Methylicorpusculum sp. TaxID=2713644 RepID=UPI0027224171|nr:2-octaprenyl-6-methoxyphenyl hydroxylase [Methylicorpusculum sp.]MDO8939810.1 2-octaprenyl-6-methoxyphenyl hydroxylase [Methylicorpusculum sp.]MDP2202389.1 2-octaprenyl-6-methoxyphenyl hydroxylase [Methylicorpusculum sp.]
MRSDYDVLIAGGGLAGNCLALALKDSGLNIAIVEAQTLKQIQESPAGDRALALASGTVELLEDLGIWHGIREMATPIVNIHVSDQGHFGKTRLAAQKENVAALGYVIRARDIETHVAKLVDEAGITLICPARVAGLMSTEFDIGVSVKAGNESHALTASLLVGADGGNSSVRKLLDIDQDITEYGQTALVATITCSLPHQNIAFERFTSSGPLALLPMEGQTCALVWTRKHEEAEYLKDCSEPEFIERLHDCFGYRLGELSLSAPRRAFPLSLIRAEAMVSGRAVIIGNAVHQLHPVAGQGFNLGLRDVVQLADTLLHQIEINGDIGDPDVLKQYADTRQQDLSKVIGFTHTLVSVFSNQWAPLALVRNLGLALLDIAPSGKSLLTRHAMGLASQLPRLGKNR